MVVDLVVSGYVVDVFEVCIRSGDDGVESWWYDTWWVVQDILFVARSLTRDVKGSIKCYLQYQLALIKWNNECWMEFCVFAEKISVLSYRVLRKKCKKLQGSRFHLLKSRECRHCNRIQVVEILFMILYERILDEAFSESVWVPWPRLVLQTLPSLDTEVCYITVNVR